MSSRTPITKRSPSLQIFVVGLPDLIDDTLNSLLFLVATSLLLPRTCPFSQLALIVVVAVQLAAVLEATLPPAVQSFRRQLFKVDKASTERARLVISFVKFD